MNPATIGVVVNSIYIQIREKQCKGTTIYMSCRRCNYTGSHEFKRIEPGWLPFSIKKIFLCKNCNSEMLEDGTIITTLWDRMEAFFNAGKLKDSIWELETIVATNQKITEEDRSEIIRLKNELNNINADKDLLKRQIRDLIDRIKRASK